MRRIRANVSKANDRLGKAGENLARSTLASLGVEMIENVGTPVVLLPVGKQGNIFRVIWGEPVAGDHRGILPGGRSVLAEAKTILNRNLQWSDLRPHQPGALLAHHNHGGLSLLVWIHSSGVYVLEFPLDGFGPGKGVTPERARQEDERVREMLINVTKRV